jgi:hypothetical protein
MYDDVSVVLPVVDEARRLEICAERDYQIRTFWCVQVVFGG